MTSPQNNRGVWLVLGILLIGAGIYFGIQQFANSNVGAKEEANVAFSEAKHRLGPQAKALIKVKDIDKDGQPESVLYEPLFTKETTTPKGLSAEAVYAKRVLVVRHTRRKSFELLVADAHGIVNERKAALVPVAGAVHGYKVEQTLGQDGQLLLVFTQVDSLGNAQSQPLPVRYNASTMFYEAVMAP
jgi:hypothetical protein